MIIRLAVIKNDDIVGVRSVVEELRNAVNTSDMSGMDDATEKLLSLTAEMHFVDLSEAEWKRFFDETKVKNPLFQSDYLLSGSVCSVFFPNITPEAMILQFPFDKGENGDV